MNSLYIEETSDTPSIELSISKCKFKITGKSYYVGINEFYDQVSNWIDTEIPSLDCHLNIEFYFTMVSSASLKNIINIIYKFDQFYKNEKKLSITWICDRDDIDMFDTANDISALTEIPVTIVERN